MYNDVLKKLTRIGQQHLLDGWEQLNPQEQAELLAQIASLDVSAFKGQQNTLLTPKKDSGAFEPFVDVAHSGNKVDREAGRRLIAEGKVGCLLIAGGQGTRLRLNGPKGIFPVSVVTNKSLFQLIAEKVVAAGKQFNRALPLAIMTSPLNHETTIKFFAEHQFFGLSSEQVTFFSQEMLPFLDEKGNIVMENLWKLAQGPDGNGSSLKRFVESGIWKKWNDFGVRYVNYILIDNALADPFDAELVGFHYRQSADITVKCAARRNASEKVGLLVKQNDQVNVVEYTELSDAERGATNPDGTLKHICANLSMFCLNMDFIQLVPNIKLPLHCSLKAINGQVDHKVWKFERFIFDILPHAKKVSALLFPREECFAPLKNSSGDDTLADVQCALQNHDKQVYKRVTGKQPPDGPFELPPEFLYES